VKTEEQSMKRETESVVGKRFSRTKDRESLEIVTDRVTRKNEHGDACVTHLYVTRLTV